MKKVFLDANFLILPFQFACQAALGTRRVSAFEKLQSSFVARGNAKTVRDANRLLEEIR